MNERNLPQLLNKKRILITGVSGLIGRILFNHLTDHHSNQYEVFGLDQHTHISSRYANQSIESTYPLSQEKFFQCDITDRDKLHQFIANEHIEIIIHLAAVLETHPDLDYIYHVNIQGTKNVFEAPGVERILFASSVRTIFGYLNDQPYQSIYTATTTSDILPKITADDYPALPMNESPGDEMYCRTKILGEQMANEIVRTTSKSIICIRFGWVNIWNTGGETWLKTVWLSYRDLCSFIVQSLQSSLTIHGIYFALSNNSPSWIDLDKAKRDLGYVPQDLEEQILFSSSF